MTLISNPNEINNLCVELQNSTAIAVDTEFTRVSTYWPLLSIIQLCEGQKSYILDFLVEEFDPFALKDLLTNNKVTKIFHSCRQDLEIFYKEFGILPQNLFDTQVASSLAYPEEEMGLANLLKYRLNIDLNKNQQTTNWQKRPLSQQQREYAISDVKYLHDLWDLLANELSQKGRLEWLWEDQKHLLSPETYTIDLETAWKKIRRGRTFPASLNKKTLLLLQHLSKWRELKAQTLNTNRGRILADEHILQLSQTPPNTLEALNKVLSGVKIDTQGLRSQRGRNQQGISREQLLSFSPEIWSVFQEALAIPEILWPIPEKGMPLTGKQSHLLEKLREYQVCVAQKLQISPTIIANNTDLKKFCYGQRDLAFLRGWRFEVFGEQALKF